jgi:hypothetical protein
MTRTKALLAFGAHGSQFTPGERKFFRNAVVPFIEGIAKEGGKAALIYEGVLPGNITSLPLGPQLSEIKNALDFLQKNRNDIVAKIKDSISCAETTIRCTLEKTVDKGFFLSDFEPQSQERIQLNGIFPVEWGFEDDVKKINQDRPGTVRFLHEPQDAEALYLGMIYDLLERIISTRGNDDALQFMVQYVRSGLEQMLLRDRAVVSLAEKLANEDLERSIVIPRGYFHESMVILFNSDLFDVTCMKGTTCNIRNFEWYAVEGFYQGSLREEELEKYAILELASTRFVMDELNLPDGTNAAWETRQALAPTSLETARTLSNKARTHALTLHPNIAKELGIKE